MPVHRHPIAATKINDPLANIPLDQALIARLQATYQIVREQDLRLAELFYAKLFAVAPHLRSLFTAEPAAQAKKLIASLDAIVSNLVDPQQNAAMLTALGKRHAGYGAKPEHYVLVIDLLIESMRDLLGAQADEENLREWRLALRLVSDQMIHAATSVSCD